MGDRVISKELSDRICGVRNISDVFAVTGKVFKEVEGAPDEFIGDVKNSLVYNSGKIVGHVDDGFAYETVFGGNLKIGHVVVV